MTRKTITYEIDSELPDVQLTWYNDDEEIIDFSSDYTFEVLVGKKGSAALVEKSSNITGAGVAPNIVVAWDDGELDALDSGLYDMRVVATETSSGKTLSKSWQLIISSAVNPSA